MTRRDVMRLMAAAGLGSAFASRTVADEAVAGADVTAELKLIASSTAQRYPAVLSGGKVIQPQRPLPIFHETDVLVVGGGPAGFAAAVASARTGVRTALIERYGYFGGLWTGGLVLYVEPTHAKINNQWIKTTCGIGDELLRRLADIPGGIVHYGAGQRNPTSDPEATKYVMDEMITEAGVNLFLHCWGVDAIMDGSAIRGVVFESKAGRQAIVAKVVIDASGDGDVFAAAGAEHEQRLHAIGLVHRLGNVDRTDKQALGKSGIKNLGAETPLPGVTWINLRGPSANCLDVNELTRLELEHRRAIWKHVQRLRQTAGGEQAYLLQTAPQLGVRTSRLLAGAQKLMLADARAARQFPDTIGVGGADWGPWPIPYGTLVPAKLDGLLAAGRCICVDAKLIEDMRLIATCLVTGHAAGAAAAIAVQSKCRPRDIEISRLQKLLKDQGAYLG